MNFARETITAPPDIHLRLLRWRSLVLQLMAAAIVGAILGVLLPRLPLFLAVGMVPAVVVVWWMTVRPELGLLLIMAITGGLINHDQLPYLSMGPMSFHITDLLLMYLLGITIVRLLLEPEFRYVSTRLDLPLLLFFGTVLLSVVTAVFLRGVDPNRAMRELRIVAYWLAYFAVTQLIRTKRQLNTLFDGLMVLSVLMTGLVLLQMAIPRLPVVRVSHETLVTAGAEFAGVSRVWIAGDRLIYVMLIVAVCHSLFAESARARSSRCLLAGIFFIWLFLSYQRNYWLTAAIALGIMGLVVDWSERLRALRWFLLVAVVLVFIFTVPGSPLSSWGEAALDRIFSVQGSRIQQDMSAILRQAELQYANRKVAEYPLLGVGIGNSYRPWIRRFDYLPWATTNWGLVWYCHNAYMWIWVKMGTPALIFFLWLCSWFLYRGFRNWRRIQDSKWRAIVLGFTLAFVGVMISNMVAPNFIQNWVLVVYPMMMGINELIYRWSDIS